MSQANNISFLFLAFLFNRWRQILFFGNRNPNPVTLTLNLTLNLTLTLTLALTLMECLKFDNNARSIKICQQKKFFGKLKLLILFAWLRGQFPTLIHLFLMSSANCESVKLFSISYVRCSMFEYFTFICNLDVIYIVDILDLK